jgi:hypothetical protein
MNPEMAVRKPLIYLYSLSSFQMSLRACYCALKAFSAVHPPPRTTIPLGEAHTTPCVAMVVASEPNGTLVNSTRILGKRYLTSTELPLLTVQINLVTLEASYRTWSRFIPDWASRAGPQASLRFWPKPVPSVLLTRTPCFAMIAHFCIFIRIEGWLHRFSGFFSKLLPLIRSSASHGASPPLRFSRKEDDFTGTFLPYTVCKSKRPWGGFEWTFDSARTPLA